MTLLEDYIAERTERQAIIHDRYRHTVTNPRVETVDDACVEFFTNTPGWLVRLMRFRNRAVGWLGFTAGPDEAPVVPQPVPLGHQLSVFTVIDRTETEILLGADDRHFTMRLSLELDDGELTVATAAYHLDRLGRAYLTVVAQPHKPIAALMARRIANG